MQNLDNFKVKPDMSAFCGSYSCVTTLTAQFHSHPGHYLACHMTVQGFFEIHCHMHAIIVSPTIIQGICLTLVNFLYQIGIFSIQESHHIINSITDEKGDVQHQQIPKGQPWAYQFTRGILIEHTSCFPNNLSVIFLLYSATQVV